MSYSMRAVLAVAALLSFQTAAIGADEAKPKATKGDVVQVRLTAAKTPTGVPATAELIGQGERTRVDVSIVRSPDALANPKIVATIYKGACADAKKTSVQSIDSGPTSTPPPESTIGINFTGTVPVALATLRSGGYSIGLASGIAEGSAALACGDIK